MSKIKTELLEQSSQYEISKYPSDANFMLIFELILLFFNQKKVDTKQNAVLFFLHRFAKRQMWIYLP